MSGRAEHIGNDQRLRHRLVVALAAVLALVTGILVATPASRSAASTPDKPTIATAPFTPPSGVALTETPPPWPLPVDARPYIAAAGLNALGQEQLQVHYHAHVDILANGNRVRIPAGVGFVISQGRATGLTVLHTHDTSGIVHIESAANDVFTLGQLFTEWGVALDPTHLGSFQVDGTHVLRAYVNGRRLKGDPATIRFTPHLEIALWYGPSGSPVNIPKSFHFPAGL